MSYLDQAARSPTCSHFCSHFPTLPRYELKQLDDFLEAGHGNVKDITEARDRRADVLLAVKENERERDKYKV